MRVLASLIAAAAAAAQATVQLSASSAYHVDASVPTSSAISMAMRDLNNDWWKVIGVPMIQMANAPVQWNRDAVLFFFMDSSLGTERFTLSIAPKNATQEFDAINLVGGDIRGLIYGIYHISGDFLGVDPYWWFLDLQPTFAGIIDIPSNYSYDSGSPSIVSRGAFNNDEDISGYFFTDPVGDSVYTGALADRFCELLLRLRANTIIPSTFAAIDERPYRVAAARGLMLGNHHVMPLGNDVYAWPKGVPYAYRLNPEPFHFMWEALTYYQQQQEGREMVYSLGYRGINDEPFWNQDTGCTTDECRGQTISYAIANQSTIALSTPSAHTPRFVSYMWMELLELKQAGTLVLPPNVSCIWTDFPGSFNILGVVNATVGDGFYAHIQMMSGVAAQLTEFIPPARMFRNIWEFLVRNATAYGMINNSDMKFVPLTQEAVYKYMYSPAAFNSTAFTNPSGTCKAPTAVDAEQRSAARRPGRRGPVGWWPMPAPGVNGCTEEDFGTVTPAQAQDAFILDFATRHFGGANSSIPAAVANIYGSYFNISYMDIDDCSVTCNVGDHGLGTKLQGLVNAFEAAVDSNTTPSSLQSNAVSIANFAEPNIPFVSQLFNSKVLPLQPYIPAGLPASMYATHVVTQVAIHYHHLQAMHYTVQGVYAWMAGNRAGAAGNVSIALGMFDALMGYLREGEGVGTWKGTYAHDGWTWCWGTRVLLDHLLAHINHEYAAPAPNNPYPDYAFMAYECPPNDPVACTQQIAYPFHTFNASVAWDVMVRIACAGDVPSAATRVVDAPMVEAAQRGLRRGSNKRSRGDSNLPFGVSNGTCTSTYTGAQYTGSSSTDIGLFIALNPARLGAVPFITYTLNGEAPTAASSRYTGPFSVSGNATVIARAFDAVSNQPLAVQTLGQILQL